MTAVDANPGGPPSERAAGTTPGTPGVPARAALPARPESPVLPELPELPDRPLLDPDGLLAPVADVGTELRYTQLHEVAFVGCPDCREWDEWLRRSARRGLGQAALPPTARTAHTGRPAGAHSSAPRVGGPRSAAVGRPSGDGHRHRRRAAVAALGLGVAELRRRCQRHGWPLSVGVFAPVRDQVRDHVIAHLTTWRTNLHTPPRAKQPARVWAGADGNPLARATVAESVPRDVQEVRGVVLHSGPPAGEETATGEGASR